MLYGPIKVQDLAKRNGINTHKTGEVFFIDTEGMDALDDNTSNYLCGILTIMQVSEVIMTILTSPDVEEVIKASKCVELGNLMKVERKKKVIFIERDVESEDKTSSEVSQQELRNVLLFEENYAKGCIEKVLKNKEIFEIKTLPSWRGSKENSDFDEVYREEMMNLVTRIINNLSEEKTSGENIVKIMTTLVKIFSKVDKIENVNYALEVICRDVFNEIIDKIKNTLIIETKEMKETILNNIENIEKYVRQIIDVEHKIEMDILRKVLDNKLDDLVNLKVKFLSDNINKEIKTYIEEEKKVVLKDVEDKSLFRKIEDVIYKEEITDRIKEEMWNNALNYLKKKYKKYFKVMIEKKMEAEIEMELKNKYKNILRDMLDVKTQWRDKLIEYVNILKQKLLEYKMEVDNMKLEDIQVELMGKMIRFHSKIDCCSKDFKIFKENEYKKYLEEIENEAKNYLNSKGNYLKSINNVTNDCLKKIDENNKINQNKIQNLEEKNKINQKKANDEIMELKKVIEINKKEIENLKKKEIKIEPTHDDVKKNSNKYQLGSVWKLTGNVFVDSYGSRSGKWFNNYTVHVVRTVDRNRKCPILLGDNYSECLGWVSENELH